MDGHTNSTNGYTSLSQQDPSRGILPQAFNGIPIATAMLTDPKSLKKHLANGNLLPADLPFDHISLPPRQSDEPAPTPISFDTSSITSKVDAHQSFGYQGLGRNATKSTGVPQSPSSFDPRQLLDPKRYASTQSKKDQVTMAESELKGASQKHNREKDQGQGLGSLIERVHNVSQREERPRKKQRTEGDEHESEEQKKTIFGSGGKGGEIGEYLKMKRKEGQDIAGPKAVVDLTGADDDDVVVLKQNDDKEVCYGRMDSTKVLAHLIPNPGMKATYLTKSDWPSMKLQLQRYPGNDNIIRVLDPTGKDFGNVDVRTAQALSRIMDLKALNYRTQARLNVRKKVPGEIPGEPCSTYLDMMINLYGPKSNVVSIGKFLTSKQVYLRTPFSVDAGTETCNPHAPSTNTVPRTGLHGISAGSGSGATFLARTHEEIRSDVLGMFDSLQKSENLPEMEPNPLIITKLLTHQKQGLHFMANREKERVFSEKEEDNSSLWRLKHRPNGQPIYYNVITGNEERNKPPEVLGGILADMMGLGKTLSMLSLVVGSLDESLEWAEQMPEKHLVDAGFSRNSKTTLLVSPLSTVANWEEQIATHVKAGSLKYYIFHGGNRVQDIDVLAEYDLIITTYSIVSSEVYGRGKKKNASPLLYTNFFRIILDEAHMIREQSTRQSQAICALSSQRRWAVTGTPVQNRLEDLGALIKFLRVKPFSDSRGFYQHILGPFKSADPEIIPKLRLLVDTITLRRLKNRIHLPQRHDDIVRLEFTPEESMLYEWFARDSDQKMRIIAGESKKSLGGKTYVHILRAIMRLRLICAHGRELLSEEDLKMTEGLSQHNAIDLEEDDESDKPAINPRQAYEMLMLFKETDSDICAQCGRTIEPNDSENAANGKDEVIGYMLPCFQIVCRQCMHDMRSCADSKFSGDHFKCPFCEQYLPTSFFELTQKGVEVAEEAKIMARENPRQAKIMGRYGGPHTKTKALIAALQKSKLESQDLPNDKPIKSVVFSGWTAHLDLIQIALEDNGIKYVRLDGKMTRAKRTTALDAFREDPEVTVFIISISAGGLGLNLTTASMVYVMEPQFNPAAEAQAVDRVHRLGQTREVFITRFIMHDSFEEKMLELQRKKENLADLSMNRGKLDKAEAAKQKLEELRSLFK